MKRHSWLRRLLLLLGIAILAAGMWFGWMLLKIRAAGQIVIWQTEEGGLTLAHLPLKGQNFIFVGDDYQARSPRTWEMTEPGGTDWPLVAPKVAPPEELFKAAWIASDIVSKPGRQPDPRYGLNYCTIGGLLNFYPDASEPQQMNIVSMLEWECKQDEAFCDALHALTGSASSP